MCCRILVLSITFIVIMIGVFQIPVAIAATNLDEGKRLYKEKKYIQSKQFLEKAVQEKPKSWQSHFYLGHTLTALGRYSDAKYQYELCKHSTRNPTVHAYCNKFLKQVDSYASKLKTSSSASKPSPSPSKNSDNSSSNDEQQKSAKEAEVDPIKAKIEAKKKEVMDKAKEECKSIMDRVEEQIKAEKADSSQRFRTGESGMSKAREAALRKPAEEKCKKIMDIAKRKARSYR